MQTGRLDERSGHGGNLSSPRRFLVTVRREGDATRRGEKKRGGWFALSNRERAVAVTAPARASLRREGRRRPHTTARPRRTARSRLAALVVVACKVQVESVPTTTTSRCCARRDGSARSCISFASDGTIMTSRRRRERRERSLFVKENGAPDRCSVRNVRRQPIVAVVKDVLGTWVPCSPGVGCTVRTTASFGLVVCCALAAN